MVSYAPDTFNALMYAKTDLNSSMLLLQEPTQIQIKDVVTNDIETFFELEPGIRHGLYRRYNIYGICIYSCTYYYGRRHGNSIEYYPDGKIKVKCNFNNGKLCGLLYTHHPDGSIIQALNFINGICVN